MELKRILARDTRSATEKAMALFGPDVLIISNNRVEGQTELIVALDLVEASSDELMVEEMGATEHGQTAARYPSGAALSGVNKRISSTPSSVNQPFSDHLHHLLKSGGQGGASGSRESTSTANDSGDHLLSQGREQARSQEIVSLVREELAALRQHTFNRLCKP
jgi:flagellar biosynthesis GTPase FlhF